jgi:hypothetical protein
MKIEVTLPMRILNGLDYMYYCLEEHPNSEFREHCKLLRYAVMGKPGKFKEIVDKLIAYPDKTLIPFYPARDDIEKVKGMEKVGTILDGRLYIG